MRLLAGGASVRGPAHQRDGTPNQDALCTSGLRGGWCIAVADGLGSRPLSHLGSRKAVQLFRQQARQRQDMPHGTVASVLRDTWLVHFGDRYRAHETTCLWAWVDVSGRGVAGQAGDGLLLVRSQGVFKVLTDRRQGFPSHVAHGLSPRLSRQHGVGGRAGSQVVCRGAAAPDCHSRRACRAVLSPRRCSRAAGWLDHLVELYRAKRWSEFFIGCVKAHKNIMISAGTNAGKSTFLNMLLQHVDG